MFHCVEDYAGSIGKKAPETTRRLCPTVRCYTEMVANRMELRNASRNALQVIPLGGKARSIEINGDQKFTTQEDVCVVGVTLLS